MSRWALFFLALLVFPVMVMAGSIEKKTEVVIFSGWSFPGIEETNPDCFPCYPPREAPAFFVERTQTFGNSVLVGFGVTRYLNNNMAVEGEFSIAPNHELSETSFLNCPPGEICPYMTAFPDYFFQQNVIAYSYGASFVYHFASGQIRPYVLAGVGGTSFDVASDSRTNVAWVFGGGAKFIVGKNIGLRFEVNDHLMPNHFVTDKTENDVQVRYGFVFGL